MVAAARDVGASGSLGNPCTKRNAAGSVRVSSFQSNPKTTFLTFHTLTPICPSMFPTRRTTAWSLLALLVLIATASAGSGIPGQPDTEHSNYGDMGKAKVYVQITGSFLHGTLHRSPHPNHNVLLMLALPRSTWATRERTSQRKKSF